MNDNINPNTSIPACKDTFLLDRSFILTQGKNLVIGMPYMYTEGNRSAAVRLIKIWQEDDIIYLALQELRTKKSFTVNWNLNYTGDYYLWSLADFHTLSNLPK